MAHALLALLFVSQTSADPANGWSRVEQLSSGTKTHLTYVDGRSEDRVVLGANQSLLTLRAVSKRPTWVETVPRDTVLEIAVDNRRRSPAGAIGGGIGGFLWGVSLSGLLCRTGGCALGIGIVDGLFGALLGHAVSPVHLTREIIYQANHSAGNPI